MLVKHLLPTARARLATITNDAPLIGAARLLRPGVDLVVVCDVGGRTVGVITKTDVVGQISHCEGASCRTNASAVMRRDVVSCQLNEMLRDIWTRMKDRGLKNIPIVESSGLPVGVLNARDALQMLLKETEDEEALLIEYVTCIGYR